MPLSDHVVNQRIGSDRDGERAQLDRLEKTEKRAKRKGIPVDVDDAPQSILSPILSHLPSLSGISSLKGFIPNSPPPAQHMSSRTTDIRASWQEADVDGKGKRRLLLLSSKEHALQIFTMSESALPTDPHIREAFPAPEEIYSLSAIRYTNETEETALPGVEITPLERRNEAVICARILEGRTEYGSRVAMLTITPNRRVSQSTLALSIVSLQSGCAIKRLVLGKGSGASLVVSSSVIAVSISHPTPSIHILHLDTLNPIRTSISDLPRNSRTNLPVFALSGRLLAYATSIPPTHVGPVGLGSIVTATSLASTRTTTSVTASRSSPSADHQGALLSSAVELGGGVARGVWAGIKMGARAANKARTDRLARSAQTENSGTLGDDEERDDSGESEARSLDQSSVMMDDELLVSPGGASAEWIVVIDLSPRSKARNSAELRSSGHPPVPTAPTTIAHFRLPPSGTSTTIAPNENRIRRGPYQTPSRPISFLSFNPFGTQLLAAPDDGRVQHIFELHPSGAASPSRGDIKGEVWHLYELRRGNTSGVVCEVSWDQDGRYVGVSTGKGTIHVFLINATGGPASSGSHVAVRNVNPQQLYPLSTAVSAVARIRPRHREHGTTGDVTPDDSPGVFAFSHSRFNPLMKGMICQDMTIFRPAAAQVELARLTLRSAPLQLVSINGQRRSSALSEMMKQKAFGETSDLEVEKTVKIRWMMPLDMAEDTLDIRVVSNKEETPTPAVRSSLAHAEIQTYCANQRILPGSIYTSRQVDFFAAQSIDEFSPFSIADIEARTRRLTFRPEVEARPTSPEVKSFDEPLLKALHSVIESPTDSQIPGLPNGHPGKNRWRSIPIRHVAVGLGEGVDRVRREYVRAQHTRAKRRASEAAASAANGLSFEEDAVFATAMEGQEEDDDDDSSPSSAVLPATNTDESGQEQDDEWGDRWEEEYRKAVEDDGGPEELVLGLMDEEEEERRKWMSGTKKI